MSNISPINHPGSGEGIGQGSAINTENYQALIEEIKEENPDQEAGKKKKKVTSRGVIERQVSPQEVIRDFASKMADSSIHSKNAETMEQIKQDVQQDIDQFYKAKTNISEQVTISAQASSKQPQAKKQNLETQKLGTLSEAFVEEQLEETQKQALKTSQKKQTTKRPLSASQKKAQDHALGQYIQKYSESLMSSKAESKNKKTIAKEKLKELKIPTKHIQHAEEKVRGLIRKDLKKRIKESFIDLALSFRNKKVTTETLTVSQKYKRLLQGGYEQGAINKQFNTLDDIKEEARSELRAFLADELDFILTTKKINGASAKDLIDAFNRFNDIATASKFNAANYLAHFNKKCDDLGLNYFKSEAEKGQIDTESPANDMSDNNQSNQEKNQDLLDEIRSLFMEKAIRKDFRSQIELGLKLRKAKKKVSNLMPLTKKMLQKLEKEGIEEAKGRLWAMIEEGFEERSTLTSLKGAEGKIVQHKISHALKRLRSLDALPSKAKLDQLRDRINTAMFSIIKEEYLKVEALIQSNPSETLLRTNKKKYLAILNRLKEETDIKEEISSSIIKNLQLSEKTNIIEAA